MCCPREPLWLVCLCYPLLGLFFVFVVSQTVRNVSQSSCSQLVNCQFSNPLRSILPFHVFAIQILLKGINEIIIHFHSEINGEVADSKDSSGHGTKIILILGVNIGILVLAGCVGVTCYSKRANLQLYNKIPGSTTNLWSTTYSFDTDSNNYAQKCIKIPINELVLQNQFFLE